MSRKNCYTLKFIIHLYWFWWKFIEISIPNGEQWLSNHFCVGAVWRVSPPLLTTYCPHAFSGRVKHFLLLRKTFQDYISGCNHLFIIAITWSKNKLAASFTLLSFIHSILWFIGWVCTIKTWTVLMHTLSLTNSCLDLACVEENDLNKNLT